MSTNSYVFPDDYQQKIEAQLNNLGFSLNRPGDLAQAIKKLSDHFIQEGHKLTPWQSNAFQAAYLAYFFPLNYVRNLKVIHEIKKLGLSQGLNHIIDIGAGCGTSSLAWLDSDFAVETLALVESSNTALSFFKSFLPQKDTSQISYQKNIDDLTFRGKTVILSYSLNELKTLPSPVLKAQNIIIIEPSTYVHSQNLINLRAELIEKGLYAWAPCVHQSTCPMQNAKSDWCHDRAHWKMNKWIFEIEKLLPIKNNTLSFSYLILSQQQPTAIATNSIRLVGDERIEKGKVRWMACRNNEREFVSWLTKNGRAPDWKRGDLIKLLEIEKKGNELRPIKLE